MSHTDLEMYRKLVDKLNYLTVTRPDIAYSVNVVNHFISFPTVTHWDALEQIASSKVDKMSITGYCVFMEGNLISWRSKKQNIVSRSSAESERGVIIKQLSTLPLIHIS
ncbi:uncharacterized mitochondrial protein AtMg00810-like [Manihot esculenta]|uniref:uncharacterized mitochondrial protein AtMg00810-like n=1 Tax=Manihot esculenta TaxID=3983 RepID=UPI000B5D215C|nr:uncharacterized mitochondrial protein AtMg00810-like [Manihot esculenta]